MLALHIEYRRKVKEESRMIKYAEIPRIQKLGPLEQALQDAANSSVWVLIILENPKQVPKPIYKTLWLPKTHTSLVILS